MLPSEIADPDLIARALRGENEAFAVLIEPTLGPGFRLAYGMLQDAHAAEDVVQEAALRAWRHLDQLRTGKPLLPWFLGIVANQCRSVRRARWWGLSALATDQANVAGPEEQVIQDQDLRRALMRLGAGDRAALVLYYYLDLTSAQVAEALVISPEAARARISRGARRLQPSLSAYEALP